jgi:ADP-ribose pyrophosphatase YjhB (NUDIX family)
MMLRFNIRVYGILVNSERQVLVTDELIRGMAITKFPGGGLEIGEGTRDCLKREFKEEMDLAVEVGEHLYTTDFYQQSAFNPEHQIISIYYSVKALEEIKVRISTTPFHFDNTQLDLYKQNNETESFRFIHIDNLTEESVTLPIDKLLIPIIKNKVH